MEQIRLLRADEIECRIGSINEKGLSLLLYKDARADMKILDEVFTPMGWQRKHDVIGGNLYCTVSVKNPDTGEWIDKQDVGTESYTEKEKGQASDSFKRACVSLGIGRELYTAPFIWVAASKTKIEKKNGKDVCYDRFRVTDISYNDNREIVGLAIINQDGNVVYCLGKTAGENKPMNETGNAKTMTNPIQKELEIGKELKRTGVALDTVLERYGVSSIGEMPEDVYRKAMNSLKRTKSAA